MSLSLPPSSQRDDVDRGRSVSSSELRGRIRELEAALAAKERELHDVRARGECYRTVLQNLPNAAVSLFDRELRYVVAEGRGLMQDLGADPTKVVGRFVHEVVSPANVDGMVKEYRRTLEGHTGSIEVERNGRTLSIHMTPVRDADGEILLGMMTTYDVTAFRAVELALKQQTQLVGLLQAVTFAANAAQNSVEAMQICLDEVCGYMGWPIGHVYLAEGAALVPSNIWHFGDSLWSSASAAVDVGGFVAQTGRTTIARGEGFVGSVFESGRSLSMEALEDSSRAGCAGAAGIKTGFALPVLVGSEVAAVLEFYAMTDGAPDANALAVLSNVGTQIGRVIERERAHALLEAHAVAVRSMSIRDELTALYNRRGFMDLAARELERAGRNGSPSVLFFADLNGMKPINDQLGHEEGDRALVDIADVLRKVFRSSDIVARLGGDEYVVLATGVDATVAAQLRTRITREIDAFNATQSRPYQLSVSVGAALYDPASPRSLEALVSEADAAMYEQKRERAAVQPLSKAVTAI